MARRAEPLADLEPVELRQHHVEHDEIDGLLAEAPERLVAVACGHDAIAVALEWVREELLDGLLVVHKENGGGVRHGRVWARPTIAAPFLPLPVDRPRHLAAPAAPSTDR